MSRVRFIEFAARSNGQAGQSKDSNLGGDIFIKHLQSIYIYTLYMLLKYICFMYTYILFSCIYIYIYVCVINAFLPLETFTAPGTQVASIMPDQIYW